MKVLLTVVALCGSSVPCAAAPLPFYYNANIGYCLGSFAAGPCTNVTHSSGAPISHSGTVTTQGESITYMASSVAMGGTLGGKVSLTSNTFNSSGPGVMVDALEQLVDSVTVAGPGLGTGFVALFYTLEGTNTASGVNTGATFGPHGVPYACVKAGVGDPVFPFGCVAYDQPAINGTFAAGIFPITYNQAFPLWFQLESIAGTGFGPGRNTGIGSSTADFFNTAAIEGFVFYDANMNPLQTPVDVTSALGISYRQLHPVPEPATLTLLGTGAIGVLATRRKRRKSNSQV